jgi:hypothetical protein
LDKKALVKEYTQKRRYFSLDQIVNDLGIGRKLAKDYIFECKRGGRVFDAGRGYYSSVGETFTFPQVSRIEAVRQFIRKQFPEIELVVWDTKMFAPFYHHTQTQHITFVEVEKDLVLDVHQGLYAKFQAVQKERRVRSALASFDVTINPVIVRKLPSRSPHEGTAPALEKVLVDMYVDLDRYNYISQFDYFELWREMIHSYRINIGHLVAYSKRRECSGAILSQLIDNKNSYAIDFCQIINEIGKRL